MRPEKISASRNRPTGRYECRFPVCRLAKYPAQAFGTLLTCLPSAARNQESGLLAESSRSFPKKPAFGLRRLHREIPLCTHVQVVLLPKPCDRLYHGGGMMGVNGSLVCPAVNQENGFRILERLIVLLPQVPLLRADRLYRSALLHLAGKGTCCSIGSTVPQIDIDFRLVQKLSQRDQLSIFRTNQRMCSSRSLTKPCSMRSSKMSSESSLRVSRQLSTQESRFARARISGSRTPGIPFVPGKRPDEKLRYPVSARCCSSC